jgi:hypothetical protein
MNRISIATLKEVEKKFGEFDIDQVIGGSNQVYLRFGYWNRVEVTELKKLILVEEDFCDDEDTGAKFMYRLK